MLQVWVHMNFTQPEVPFGNFLWWTVQKRGWKKLTTLNISRELLLPKQKNAKNPQQTTSTRKNHTSTLRYLAQPPTLLLNLLITKNSPVQQQKRSIPIREGRVAGGQRAASWRTGIDSHSGPGAPSQSFFHGVFLRPLKVRKKPKTWPKIPWISVGSQIPI